MKVFAYLAVVLMLVSILPAGALATRNDDRSVTPRSLDLTSNDTVQNETNDWKRDRVNTTDYALNTPRVKSAKPIRATIQSDAAKYITPKEKMENARNEYADSKKVFQDLKIKVNNGKISADSDDAINATRAYVNNSIQVMIRHLETIKENTGDSDKSIIDGYIEQLNLQQEKIESAQTRQEFAEAAKEVRKIWNDAQKRAKYIAGKTVDNRLNNYLVKSDAIALRIESEIKRISEAGENVEELEEMLAKYNELIGQAKENQELARETIRNRNGDDEGSIDDANRYMREATRNIQEANKVLKELFDELKSHRRGGSVSLDGAGTLTTEGSGTAVFSGDLNMTISATNAKLVIKDLAGDAEIIIDGEYTKVNDDDDSEAGEEGDAGDEEDEADDDNNRALVYHDFTGTTHITGSRLTVMIHGDDLTITAEGEGSSILSGRGSYNVEKAGVSSEDMNWAGDDNDDEDDVNESNDSDEDESDSNNESDDEDESNNADDVDEYEDNNNDSDSDDAYDGNETDGNNTEGNNVTGVE